MRIRGWCDCRRGQMLRAVSEVKRPNSEGFWQIVERVECPECTKMADVRWPSDHKWLMAHRHEPRRAAVEIYHPAGDPRPRFGEYERKRLAKLFCECGTGSSSPRHSDWCRVSGLLSP